MVAFALSCVGLLLFLWLSFGGTIPFAPKGYEVRIAFPDASQLANEADVRIAGVSVGKVVAKSLDPKGNRTIATIQMDNKFAPIHKDAQAILREKTILGETYVELTPGTPARPTCLTTACSRAPTSNPRSSSTRSSTPSIRPSAMRSDNGSNSWPSGQATTRTSTTCSGNLPSFAADGTDLLQVLDVEHAAVVNLVQNGGTVFAALSKSQSALRNLITTGETTFPTTAINNNAIANTFHVFPTFLNEAKSTMTRLQSFSLNTDPLIKELEPVATNLKPTLASVRALSP